jgi:DUF1365 family protein
VRLLCLPAMAGHCFNPVTFHYCFAEQGEALEALVVEITNTPWRERRVYVFDARAAGAEGTLDVRLPKDFHISPFLDQDLDFHWQFQAPGRRLLVQMEDLQRGAGPGRPPVGTRLFDSTLSAERVPLSPANLRRFALRRALPGLRVLGAIHWQAALLWLRRTPFCIHPAKRAKTLGDAAGPGAPP